MTQEEVRAELESMVEDKYRDFSASLIPGVDNMLGIRLPKLRVVAKRLAKEDWEACMGWKDNKYFEETMLQGMVLGYAKADIAELLRAFEEFIPKINNWSVNDSFCNTFKAAGKYQKEVWDFLMGYKNSDKEYEVRVVAVMLMIYYLNDEYVDRTFDVLAELDTRTYYASMAVAWAFSAAWAKYPERTKKYLSEHTLDAATYKKTLQKCIESYKVSDEDKEYIRSVRKSVG